MANSENWLILSVREEDLSNFENLALEWWWSSPNSRGRKHVLSWMLSCAEDPLYGYDRLVRKADIITCLIGDCMEESSWRDWFDEVVRCGHGHLLLYTQLQWGFSHLAGDLRRPLNQQKFFHSRIDSFIRMHKVRRYRWVYRMRFFYCPIVRLLCKLVDGWNANIFLSWKPGWNTVFLFLVDTMRVVRSVTHTAEICEKESFFYPSTWYLILRIRLKWRLGLKEKETQSALAFFEKGKKCLCAE